MSHLRIRFRDSRDTWWERIGNGTPRVIERYYSPLPAAARCGFSSLMSISHPRCPLDVQTDENTVGGLTWRDLDGPR
jgi:hypothetical protein